MKSRDYLVVVDGPDQVRALSPDIQALAKLDVGIGGVIVTAPGNGHVDYVSRFFAPAAGIDEDPRHWLDKLHTCAILGRAVGETDISHRTVECPGRKFVLQACWRSREDRWRGALIPARDAGNLAEESSKRKSSCVSAGLTTLVYRLA